MLLNWNSKGKGNKQPQEEEGGTGHRWGTGGLLMTTIRRCAKSGGMECDTFAATNHNQRTFLDEEPRGRGKNIERRTKVMAKLGRPIQQMGWFRFPNPKLEIKMKISSRNFAHPCSLVIRDDLQIKSEESGAARKSRHQRESNFWNSE